MIQTRKPVTVIIAVSIVILPGIFSFLNIPIEISPTTEYPTLQVSCSWQGASPESVVKRVTTLIEQEAAKVKHVRKITSTSSRDMSSVRVEFDRRADMQFARFELSERLSSVKRDLPEEVSAPEISTWIPDRRERKRSMLSISFYGDYSLHDLKEIVDKNIRTAVKAVEGVADADIVGGRDYEVAVMLNPRLIEDYRISPYEIVNAINQKNKRYLPGSVVHNGYRLHLKFDNRITDLESIADIEIGRYGRNPVRIGDLGRIEVRGKEVYSISRIDGMPTLMMNVERERGTNAVNVSNAVRQKITDLLASIPYKISMNITYNEGGEISSEISTLLKRVGLIVLIIMTLLILLLRKKRTFLILMASVILTETATFNLLYFTGVTVNFITLAALAIGLGIVIDNGIVILENIFQKRESGIGIKNAVEAGTSEMIRPVFASTLTTLAVFIPFALFSGRLQQHYLPLAVALAYSLVCSLIISFSFIPAASYLFLGDIGRKGFRKNRLVFYKKFTRWSLRNGAIITFIILVLGLYAWDSFRGVETGRWAAFRGKEYLSVSVRLPRGSEINRADQIARKFEKIFVGAEGVKAVNTNVYPERAYVYVDFTHEGLNSASPYGLKEKAGNLAMQHAGMSVGVYGFGDPIWAGGITRYHHGNYEIEFKGYDLDQLHRIADDLSKKITGHVRVRETNKTTAQNAWWASFMDELRMRLRLEKLAIDGINFADLMQQIRYGLGFSSRAGQIILDGEKTDLTVMEEGAGRRQLEDLQRKIAVFRDEKLGRLGDYFDTRWEKMQDQIYREDQQYQLILTWEYRGPNTAGENYYDAIFNSISLPAGYTAEETSRHLRYMTREEHEEIYKVLAISLIIIFMILASLYESFIKPFVIFFSIPFALIGVFLIYNWTDSVFDSSAYIGVILLGGMVVNNAIILVDRFNNLIHKGMRLKKALVEGTFSRIRPIILTTTTTVGGLLPLIIGTEEGLHDIWYNLALATIGGLISSALFTITIIPIFYRFFERSREFCKDKMIMYRTIWNSGGRK